MPSEGRFSGELDRKIDMGRSIFARRTLRTRGARAPERARGERSGRRVPHCPDVRRGCTAGDAEARDPGVRQGPSNLSGAERHHGFSLLTGTPSAVGGP
jgi:hypothetical protein